MTNSRLGQEVGGRYKIEEFIGEGGMQYVYKAHDLLLGRKVALKTPKNNSATKRFRRSAVVAAKVNHHNVAKTLDYINESGNRYLIEELVEGSDLQAALMQRAKFLDPYLAACIFNQLARGLSAAHHAGVIHRDLKPTNVMISGGYSLRELKITDFGIAKMADEELSEAAKGGTSTLTTSQTAVGALPYMAPEAIETPDLVGPPADIWSIGAMFYHMLTGDFPYGNGLKAVRRILANEIAPAPKFMSANPQFSFLARDLLDISLSCLKSDPGQRPTADELVQRCESLCYSKSPRYEGSVKSVYYNRYGFIARVAGDDVFFNQSSVYGPQPAIPGSKLCFSMFKGGGAWRAHPVIVLDS
ncbi:serine/threonine-protein kinase [Marinobacter sp.]|uniref:serine/threonine-protein kinase n=1 Tax=Marinobacter sp. TaxID=50741 RepID=UPI003A93F72D